MIHRASIALSLALSLIAARGTSASQPFPQRPPRDAAEPAEAASGTITGRVRDARSGQPLARAYVLATGATLDNGRASLTDANGTYALDELPPGQYTVRASKAGFVTSSFGQRNVLEPRVPITLRPGQVARGIDVALLRGAVITGQLVDQSGEPMVGVAVQALRAVYRDGQRQLVVAARDQSDDRGEYRIFGLAPGNYYLSAMVAVRAGIPAGAGVRRSRVIVEDPTSSGYAPTYYPGVTSQAAAQVVRVGPAEEAAGINFAVRLVTTARLEGVVFDPEGRPAPGATVLLAPSDGGVPLPSASNRGRTDGSGAFVLRHVPPGAYLLHARAGRRRGRGLVASQPVSIAGQSISGLTLLLSPGAVVRGSVIFEPGSGAPEVASRIRIVADPVTPLPFDGRSTARLGADGSFELESVPDGAYVFRVSGAAEPWTVKAVYLAGKDVTDVPTVILGGRTIEDVQVVMTDRAATISGSLRDDQGRATPQFTIVAFAADRALWGSGSRHIAVARPDQEGAFHLGGLPAGNYLLTAVNGLEQGSWYDPSVLEWLTRSAAQIQLNEGDHKVFDLTP